MIRSRAEGTHLALVPLSAFEVSDKRHLRVKVSREVIAGAPSITRSEWPRANLAQDAWVGEVDRYAMAMISPAETSRSDAPGRRKQ